MKRAVLAASRILIPVGITAAFALVGGRLLDTQKLLEGVRHASPGWLLLALGTICLTVLLRAIRLCLLIGEPPRLDLIAASLTHRAAISIVPAKLGELALPALLRRLRRIDPVRGIGLLLLLRVMDLFALATIGFLAAALAYGRADHRLGTWLIVATALSMSATVLFLLRAGRFALWVQARGEEGRLFRLLRRLFSEAHSLTPRLGLQLGFLSLVIRCTLFTAFFAAARSVSPSSTWAQVAVAGTVASLAFMLPVNGLANLGPFEGAWVAAAATLGISASSAVSAALLAHASVIAVALVLGAGGAVVLWADRKNIRLSSTSADPTSGPPSA